MPRNNKQLPDLVDQDLEDDFRFGVVHDLRKRLESVENDLKATRIRDSVRALSGDTDTTRGEQVLAKAQAVAARLATPEGVLERAQKVMPTAIDIGVVQGFLSIGTKESFAKAVSIVANQEERNDRAHAENAVDGMFNDFDHAEDTSSLRDELADLRQTVATLTGRLVQLESLPMSARQEVVAKAYTRVDAPSSTAKNDASSLLQRGQGVIDSVSTIGILSGLVNDGKLHEARQMVESAELDHENKVKAAERKRLRQ